MSEQLLYLSRSDIIELAITPEEARQAINSGFRDHFAGLNRALPKTSLDIGPGHGFQSMSAASQAKQAACMKWVAMAPVAAGGSGRGINGIVCVNDYESGTPLAIMDGDELTLIRTAAMSAAAAAYLAPPEPQSIGMVGCGEQAYAHLNAFRSLFPSLSEIIAFSRSRSSAEQLCRKAREQGLDASYADVSADLLSRSDIVISMVPGAPGLEAFLDARLLRPSSFVSAVDIGRSWLPDSFAAFDRLATDSLAQSKAPYDVNGKPVSTALFDSDLAGLAGGGTPKRVCGKRSLFCFRGFGLGDLALAGLALARAREMKIGTVLPR
ncbi:ornithine cyclodeaminase family protein [Tianweitania sp.]|uniref:ornithine cyclodeaminase family protein n=1 Tax=Tianweitania sp. TaxID=2021634 RepID=UPI0028981F6D|nr:ornithine cyclodeaminase family protein [Tianweitania sp.]